MVKSPKASKKFKISERKFRRNLLAIAISALLVKILIILRIQGFDWYTAGNGDLVKGLGELLDNNLIPPNSWYGADGENYLRGLQGLVEDGFYSEQGNLSYWPAGYPLLLWPIIEIFRGYFFLVVSLLQSLIYTASSIWLVDEIRRTRLSKAAYLIAFLLAFNPTLSLGTATIGYELPVVAFLLAATAALMRNYRSQNVHFYSWESLVASVSLSLATFMQPRLLIIAFIFFCLWALSKFKIRTAAPFLALTMGVVSLAPALMIYRNHEVHGYSAISTNLGVTMRLGAGPATSGGFSTSPTGVVECPKTEGNAAEVDNAVVRCVVKWYLENPVKSIELFWNKARFFWSPWFGPEANGTMARNPWSINHPFRATAQTQDGFNLIFGGFGKLISWIWMFLGILLLGKGFVFLWKVGDLERLIGLIAGTVFVTNLISSMLTIGDHRFRIPSMGLSLVLQAIGIISLYTKQRSLPSRTNPLVSWPSFRSRNSGRGNP